MTLPYIRRVYQVPAFKGHRVEIEGHGQGTITSGTCYIKVRLDGGPKRPRPFHPAWKVTYLGKPQ